MPMQWILVHRLSVEALLTFTEGSRGAMHLWDFCTLTIAGDSVAQ